MSGRVDSFDGTNEEYTSYLEKELLATRHELTLRDNVHIAKRKRTSEPQWKTCAKRLIAETPNAQTWTSSLRENGIHDIMKNGDAIQCLLDSKFEPRHSAQVTASGAGDIHESDDHIIISLETYARTTAMRWTLASTVLALANFQKLLVISACAVLIEGTTPIAKVYDIVRICIGKDSSDSHCKRIITTARYLNVLIDTLNIHKWGDRAGELLLICKQFNSDYVRLTHHMQGTERPATTIVSLVLGTTVWNI
jgi:hypothetical protein